MFHSGLMALSVNFTLCNVSSAESYTEYTVWILYISVSTDCFTYSVLYSIKNATNFFACSVQQV